MELVKNMLSNFTLHLHNHLYRFTQNLGDFSEGQKEYSVRTLKLCETFIKEYGGSHMMADYCWSLLRDCTGKLQAINSYKKIFVSNKLLMLIYLLCLNFFLFNRQLGQVIIVTT